MKKYLILAILVLLIIFSNTKFANADYCQGLPPGGVCTDPDANGNCQPPFVIVSSLLLNCSRAVTLTVCSSCQAALPPPAPVPSPPTTAPATATTFSTDYKLLEGIPGFLNAGATTTFPEYIMALYNFGLWTIGLCAMIMIMIGGYMYLTSAGNTSETGKAKGIITDAIAGLILALVSFLLLYIINPNLVQLNF
jgi:hypothetical protein